jgi:hypothetical protein
MLQQVATRKIDEHPADLGCEIATEYLQERRIDELSFCRCCPFIFCIKDIRNQTKQLLQNSEAIENVFKLDSQGKPFCEICELHSGHSPFTIRKWLIHQAKIQKTLDQYRWAIPYLKL